MLLADVLRSKGKIKKSAPHTERRKVFKMVLMLLILFFLANIWYSANWLTVRDYEYLSEKISSEIRIAVLSDLHGHKFGKHNEKLAEKVLEQKPDLVLMVGDFLNRDSGNSEVPCEVIRALSSEVPVFFSLGNHEIMYMQEADCAELIQEMEAAGAEVLDEEYVDLDVCGTPVRLGGMFEYAFGLNGEDEALAAPEEIKNFLIEFQSTDRLKIMMAHRPDSFIFGDASSVWDVDLVVSGHDHGGQVIVPMLGGMYGGDQGWFPEYVHGMYQKDKIHLFVTSGLGSHRQVFPRLNNPPEIAMLICKQKGLSVNSHF